MKARVIRTLGAVFGLSFAVAACGGGSAQEPPAKAGESPAASASAAAAPGAPSSEGGAAPEEKAVTKAATAAPPAKEVPKPSRKPSDVLTAQNTLFMLAFDESDAGKAAHGTCTKSSGGDPQKVATCLAKERAKIDADGHGFKKDKQGNQIWVVVHRKGQILLTTHKLHMSFGNETENSIVVKPEGKDKGKKPGRNTPGEFTVEVPSDYKIIISDPRFGKLVYEAKVGLVPDNLL